MKKTCWITLLVLLVTLTCVATAQADATIPLRKEDVPNLVDMPPIPKLSVSKSNGQYVVDVEAQQDSVSQQASVLMAGFLDGDIGYFTYDSKKTKFVLDDPNPEGGEMINLSYMGSINGQLASFIYANLFTDNINSFECGQVLSFALENPEDLGKEWFQWNLNRVISNSDAHFEWIRSYDNNNPLQYADVTVDALTVSYDEQGNILRYDYSYDSTCIGNEVTYSPDGTLIECEFRAEGKENRYSNDTWYDEHYQTTTPPEGFDVATLKRLYPPLIGSTPIAKPTSVPTPSPIPEATPTATPDATESPKPTLEPTPKPTPEPTPTVSPDPEATPTVTPDATESPKPTLEPTSEPTPEPTPTPTPAPYTWYSHNTLGLVGLPLRDLYPDLTDKWYNIVPVDLTIQGRQTYPLVASNLYYMGEAYVDILDGNVTVSYDTPGNQWTAFLAIEDECLAWFTKASDVTSDFLQAPSSDFSFGQPVSIQDSLGGADTALLFICNHVTYRQPCLGNTGYLTRYWPNRREWKQYRDSLMTLLEQLPE